MKKIFLTGGTGSFGEKFIEIFLQKYPSKQITIFSRDEIKQWDLNNKLNNSNVNFIIGDVRDKERLTDSIAGHDIVIHAAATKIVPTAEINPSECIKTNINGAINVIEASNKHKVNKVIALSTDKACNPVNLYGATKLASDKLFLSANIKSKTNFTVVRYGNVIGSRGSIIPFFINQKKNKILTVTDKRMTRFMITKKQAVDHVFQVIREMQGGEIFVKKIPTMNILDIARAIDSQSKVKIIGIRPGEKIHEQMISSADSHNTYEFENYYKILNPNLSNHKISKITKGGKKVKMDFTYSSENTRHIMTINDLKKIIKNKEI